jgi:hypothetical protein
MPQEQGVADPYEVVEDALDSEENPGLPTLELGEVRAQTKESRRETLSRLDHLLEELELANLAELSTPPRRVVHALGEHGLPNARSYTILELIEIVLNSQGPLMKANRSGSPALYLNAQDDTLKRFSTWDPAARWSA